MNKTPEQQTIERLQKENIFLRERSYQLAKAIEQARIDTLLAYEKIIAAQKEHEAEMGKVISP